MALAVIALAAITVLLSRLEPAAPTVDGALVWTGTVRRSDMLRQVRGTGHLRPRNILFLSALTGGRIERVLAEPGLKVNPETVLLEMSNPDVELNALEAERQLTAVEAELVNLRGGLETGILSQQATVASVRNQYRDAVRRLEAFREIPEEVSKLDLERTQDEVEELEARLAIEQRTLEVQTEGRVAQLAAKQSQVDRQRALAEFQRNRVEALSVKAGTYGTLRELAPEKGQWIGTGATLGVIIEPGKLMAEVGIPEVQARDVLIGQEAEVDTRSAGSVKVPGRVVRIDPSASGGLVTVDIELTGELPRGALADQSIEGIITIERLVDVLNMNRPTSGQAHTHVGMFKLVDGGQYAVRVTVRIGQISVNSIEIVEGLEEGDEVILSDMARWDAYDRVRIRN